MAKRDSFGKIERLGADANISNKSAKAAHSSQSSKHPSATSSPPSRSGWSSRSPHGAEVVNDLLTPRSEGSCSAESISVDRAPNAKVAIPRDVKSLGPPPIGGRVARACSSCRSRKVKCSGEQPVCRQCHELKLPCGYPLGWNERLKK